MYFGLLRVSEVAKGAHPVLAKDVQIGINKKKFLLILRTSKTHRLNMKPQLVKITSKRINNMTTKRLDLPCPFQLLQEFVRIHGNFKNDSEIFFVFSDGSPIKPEKLNNCLKLGLRMAGFNDSLYSSHSLRIGRTCDLFKLGLPVETIKKLGRWRSNAVFKYIRN